MRQSIVQENLDQPVNATLLRVFYNTKATLQHIRRKTDLFLPDVQARNKSHGVLPRSQNQNPSFPRQRQHLTGNFFVTEPNPKYEPPTSDLRLDQVREPPGHLYQAFPQVIAVLLDGFNERLVR